MYYNYDDLVNRLRKKSLSKMILLIAIISLFSIVLICLFPIFAILGIISIGVCFGFRLFQLFRLLKNLNWQRKNPDTQLIKTINSELLNVIDYFLEEYILTENYIISLKEKIELIPYSEIIFIDKGTGLRFSAGIGTGVHICGFRITPQVTILLKNGKKYSFYIEKATTMISCGGVVPFTEIVCRKNKNILFGKTKENRQMISEKYNIKI